MTPLEALIATRKLIEDPNTWIQGTFARDSQGLAVDPTDPSAVKFCIVGALMKTSKLLIGYTELSADLPIAGLAVFNDTHTHAEVLALVDRTISKLSAPS